MKYAKYRNYVYLSVIFILIFGCKKNEESQDSGIIVNDTQNQNYDDSTSLQLNDEAVYEEEGVKTINWRDGGSYEYYYTEIINIEDTNGEIITVTVYINNVPVNSDCEIKKCKWCNSNINLVNSYYEEFPNLDNLRENPNRETIGQVMLSLGMFATSYMFVENSNGVSIRTVTNTICEYDEFKGYCSKKCYHEENY